MSVTSNRPRRWSFEPAQLEGYRGAGYDLIPLNAPDAKDAKGRAIGKAPLKGWRADPPISIEDAADRLAWANVGVRLGDRDLVIDVDPRNFAEGDDPLRRLQDDLGIDLGPDRFPRVVTGSGGLHIYMRMPEPALLVDTLDAYQGIEFKSLGRQVVAAGSCHPDCNRPYVFSDAPEALRLTDGAPEAPKALVELCRRPEASFGASGPGDISPEQLGDMLGGLLPEDYRDPARWLELMMACHHATAGNGRDEFIEWSTGDPQYVGDAWIIGRRWDSLHADDKGRRITERTLFKALIDAGREDLIPRATAEEDFTDFLEDRGPEPITLEAALAECMPLGDEVLHPDEFVLDGFLAAGLTTIAGAWGAGKSTNLIPLFATAAHLTPADWDIRHQEIRRHVVWITEAPHQARTTLYSMAQEAGAATWEEFGRWFHLVPSRRLEPKNAAKRVKMFADAFAYRDAKGFLVRPVIVLDTASANIDLESENDASEVGKMMSALKELHAPVVVIGHTPKAVVRSDLSDQSFRGSGVWEADAEQTFYLLHDESAGMRFLAARKIRFSGPAYTEVDFGTRADAKIVDVPWAGQRQHKGYCHGVPTRSDQERRNDERELRTAERQAEKQAGVEAELLRAIEARIEKRKPLTKGDVKKDVRCKEQVRSAALEALIETGSVVVHDLVAEDRGVLPMAARGKVPSILLPASMSLDEYRAMFDPLNEEPRA
jgi:hypothetical protein